MNDRNNITFAVAALATILLLVFSIGYYKGRTSPYRPMNVKTDTLVIERIDTAYVDRPVPVWCRVTDSVLVAVTDTVVRNDTVYTRLPMERKVYSDSTYRAVVSGYRASLDSLWIYRTTRTITITNTVQAPGRRFGASVGIGPGVIYSPFTSSHVDAGIGIFGGLTYTF